MNHFWKQKPLLLEINTHRSKLRDVVEKIVKARIGMSLPLVMHGAALLYEVGDDLDEVMVANYQANLDKVVMLFDICLQIFTTLYCSNYK